MLRRLTKAIQSSFWCFIYAYKYEIGLKKGYVYLWSDCIPYAKIKGGVHKFPLEEEKQ